MKIAVSLEKDGWPRGGARDKPMTWLGRSHPGLPRRYSRTCSDVKGQ
jgi:hypothetical protein